MKRGLVWVSGVAGVLAVLGCSDAGGSASTGSTKTSASSPPNSSALGNPASSNAKPATPGASPSSATAPLPAPTGPVGPAGSAFSHVAADCEIVIIGDLVKVRSQPTIAKEVMPKLEKAWADAKPKDEKLKNALALAKEMGISPKTAQNVALCGKGFAGDKPSFGVLLGTEVKPGAFLSFIDKASNGKALGNLVDLGGVKVAQSPKASVGQLPDGVFEVANQDDLFKSLIPLSDAMTKLTLDTSKEVAFYGAESFIKKELRKPGSKTQEAFEDVTELHGFVDLAANKAIVRLTCTSSFSALKLAAGIVLLKDDLAKENLKDNPHGAADIVRSITATSDGPEVLVEATIPASSIDSAAKALAKELERIEKSL